MLDLGEGAIERARAELRAVQDAAVKLAVLMARFGQDAERLAALLRELDAPAARTNGGTPVSGTLKRRLDEEWIGWIRHNLARGCSKDELFRILLREGFDLDAIHGELNRAPQAVQLPGLRRHESPLAELYTAEDFLDPRACAALVELIQAGLRPSTISAEDPDLAFRTSRTCDLSDSDPVVRELDRRICAAMDTSPSYAEPTQGQYYDVSQEFKPHTDYFESYELERFSTATWGQRTWTFMVYLNEPGRGGETHFVQLGLRVRPKPGLAVIWNNLLPDGRPNPNTIHQGMPVISGTKAIITKWFRRPRT